jgi:exosortase/archaeosortase family protein
VLGFVLRFGLYWALAVAGLSLVPALERWAVQGTVGCLAPVLRAVAVKPIVFGSSIQAGGANIEIVPDCTPLMPTLVLWAAVAAFPGPWRLKVVGLLAGAAAVWVFNLARVLVLMVVLSEWPRSFKFAHVYLWQAGTLLVVTAMFMFWVRLQARVLAEP